MSRLCVLFNRLLAGGMPASGGLVPALRDGPPMAPMARGRGWAVAVPSLGLKSRSGPIPIAAR